MLSIFVCINCYPLTLEYETMFDLILLILVMPDAKYNSYFCFDNDIQRNNILILSEVFIMQ